jgi:hypothetical protein
MYDTLNPGDHEGVFYEDRVGTALRRIAVAR